ncbi:MAG: holo-ACP synthase [Actinomycetes bacterium]|jgi:holo-[acyl-carrier protein] synthase
MIFGIGIDVVDIARFEESLVRTPALKARLFKGVELDRPLHGLAARFAAKEAIAKAMDAKGLFHWHDVEVINLESGKPTFILSGETEKYLQGKKVHLSLSHDAGIASAMVVIEE